MWIGLWTLQRDLVIALELVLLHGLFWILVFDQEVFRPIVCAASSKLDRMYGHLEGQQKIARHHQHNYFNQHDYFKYRIKCSTAAPLLFLYIHLYSPLHEVSKIKHPKIAKTPKSFFFGCNSATQMVRFILNKRIGDDTKAAARQSPNCIKNKN